MSNEALEATVWRHLETLWTYERDKQVPVRPKKNLVAEVRAVVRVRRVPRRGIGDDDDVVVLRAVDVALVAEVAKVEALYARDGNPITSLMAEEAIAKLASSLPEVIDRPRDLDARSDALYGAWLCAVCLGTVGMALHHKLCHTVGALFDLPHAETHAVLLPHTIAYNTPAARDAIGRAAKALGAADAADGLFDLSARLGAPRSLAEIGMPEDGIAKAAALATKNPYWNPRPIEAAGIADLLRRAWAGARPQAG